MLGQLIPLLREAPITPEQVDMRSDMELRFALKVRGLPMGDVDTMRERLVAHDRDLELFKHAVRSFVDEELGPPLTATTAHIENTALTAEGLSPATHVPAWLRDAGVNSSLDTTVDSSIGGTAASAAGTEHAGAEQVDGGGRESMQTE